MKIKNFMKYFIEGVLKYFKISMKFLNIFKVKYFIVHSLVTDHWSEGSLVRKVTGPNGH